MPTQVESLLAALEGNLEGMRHSDLVSTCRMLGRGREIWRKECEAEKAKVSDLLKVLELVHANAGESVEWIRHRTGPVIEAARKEIL
jgi:hypothetical protein